MKSHLWALMLFIVISGCSIPAKTLELKASYKNNPLALAHNFVPLEEGALYTSRDPMPEFIEWMIKERSVKTFVSLRGDFSPEQERVIRSHGAEMIVFRWSASRVPKEEEIAHVLSIMKNSHNSPVLVFCRAGADRTGFIRAYWRMSEQGWSKRDAFREFFMHGHIRRNVLDDYLHEKF